MVQHRAEFALLFPKREVSQGQYGLRGTQSWQALKCQNRTSIAGHVHPALRRRDTDKKNNQVVWWKKQLPRIAVATV